MTADPQPRLKHTGLWISDRDALAEFLDSAGPVLAFDSEFMRVNTYWAELALAQVAGTGPVALVDPLGFDAAAALAPTLADPTKVKVMHSASEDISVLASSGARELAALFDTQIAAGFAGLGYGIGYRALVERLLGVVLPKDETRSDWRRRPLTTTQLAYAEADVAHLGEIYRQLGDLLAARGFAAWCAEDCARLAAGAVESGAVTVNPHWQILATARLPLPQQARLWRILLERERIARRINRPLRWILDDGAALQLVREPPPNDAEILALLAAQRSFPQRERAQFAAFVREPVPPEELAAFQAAPSQLESEQRRLGDRIRDRAAARAAELDLPPALVAPRRLIDALVRGEKPAEFSGWRGEVLRDLMAEA
jgi:ribonuclease D